MAMFDFPIAFRTEIIIVASVTVISVANDWILLALVAAVTVMPDTLVLLLRTNHAYFFVFEP